MSPQLSMADREEKRVKEVKEELENVVRKVNYHFHSGYEKNDERQSGSIFMNFLKKQPSVISSSYLMRLKNRDFKLELDDQRFVRSIRFTDLCYGGWNQMTDVINLLNKAASDLDYDHLKETSNMMDKFYQITSKSVDSIRNFKFK